MTESEQQKRLKYEYFSYGTQFYAAGRFQVVVGMVPMAGFNLHRAVEMYLKGYLVSLDEKDRKAMGHWLPRAWEETKKRAGEPSLDQFDSTIQTLDLFEKIRYPDGLVGQGAEIEIGFRSPTTPTRATAEDGKPFAVPFYGAYLDKIDALVWQMFRLASVNHLAQSVRDEAKKYLNDDNAAMKW